MASAEHEVLQFMDPVNRAIYRYLLKYKGLSKKALVDKCTAYLRRKGFDKSKSAVAERLGHQGTRSSSWCCRHCGRLQYEGEKQYPGMYQDGHWFIELKALLRMTHEERVEYVMEFSYQAKMKTARAYLVMDEDDLKWYRSVKSYPKRRRFLNFIVREKFQEYIPVSWNKLKDRREGPEQIH